MSSEAGGGFSPNEKPGKWTFAEFKHVQDFTKDLLVDQPLIKYSIYAAGVAEVLESTHLIWTFITAFLIPANKWKLRTRQPRSMSRPCTSVPPTAGSAKPLISNSLNHSFTA